MRFVVTTVKQWQKKYPGVVMYQPAGGSTPYPFEQESAHFQSFNPAWKLCHGFVHGKPHAWLELHGVVIDLMVRRSRVTKAKLKRALAKAFKKTRTGGLVTKSKWEKQLNKFSHDKKIYYTKFKPTEVKKYGRDATYAALEHFGRYGNWQGAPSPFAGVI